jgi:hypothetical protein
MTSLARTLKLEIDAWGEKQRRSQLIGLARSGSLTPRAVALYLTTLQELFTQSQRNLHHARALSEALQLPELVAYFRGKTHEEHGHEQWAASDLTKLPTSVADGLVPAGGGMRLAQLQKALLEEHPMCFVVYVVWAEYLTVLLGDEWLDALAVCGYERTALSAVSNHVEADRAHAAQAFEVLDQLWDGKPSLLRLLDGLKRAESAFEAFCDEICRESLRGAATCGPAVIARG